MPSGQYKRRPRPDKVRERISRTLKSKRVSLRTGQPLIPWDKLFAPHRIKFSVTKGDDFTCSIPTMRQHIRNKASERGIGVETDVEGKTVTVSIIRKSKRGRK